MDKTYKYLCIIITIIFFVACGGSQQDYGEISLKDFPGTIKLQLPVKWDKGKESGIWRGTFSTEPTTFNPWARIGDGSYQLGTALDYLFDYDPIEREWKGEIIEDFEIIFDENADTMELLCTLRSNIFWSDGVQMTTDDIIYYYKELQGDKEIDPVGYQSLFVTMDDGSEKMIEIEKIDKFQFKFIFPRVVANPVLTVNTSDIVPKHIWEPVKKQGKEALNNFWSIDTDPEEIVGNGPFLLEKYVPGERVIYKKNPNYWKKDEDGQTLPYIEKIIMSFIPQSNNTARLLKFQQGEIESYGLRGVDMAVLLPEAEKKGFDIWNGGLASGVPFICFNNNPAALPSYKVELFSKKEFRYAISSLIDRKRIINETINGFAEPQYHLFGEINKYFNPEYATPYSYNPQKAEELLDQLELKDTNGDGFREDPEGNEIKIGILTYNEDKIIHDYLNIIISDMKEAGLNANLEVADFNLFVEKLLNTFDWDCFFYSHSFPVFPEQWYNVWRSDGNMHYWYPNQESPATTWEARIDEIFDKIRYTYDEKKVQELYDEFQSIIMEQLPIIPIFRKYTFSAFYKKWGNINWDVNHTAGDDSRRLYLKQEIDTAGK